MSTAFMPAFRFMYFPLYVQAIVAWLAARVCAMVDIVKLLHGKPFPLPGWLSPRQASGYLIGLQTWN
jgi:hypothetical protein